MWRFDGRREVHGVDRLHDLREDSRTSIPKVPTRFPACTSTMTKASPSIAPGMAFALASPFSATLDNHFNNQL
jgi:hypothetical protein